MSYNRRQQDKQRKHNPIAKDLRHFHPKTIRHKKRELTDTEIQKEMEELKNADTRD